VAERGVIEFPNWKARATPEERFLELANIAKRNPERFQRMILVYQEDLPHAKGHINNPTITRYVVGGNNEAINTTTALGLLDLGRHELLRFTHKY
jgi:hypothetical protein